jgi:predicted alpha/beta hydrolase
MAERGFTLLAYDYRGIGDSKYEIPAPPAQVALDWARVDQTTAADYLLARFPHLTPMVIGHSFGGQMLGISPHAATWCAALLVASAHGYWAKWPAPRKYRGWCKSFVLRRVLSLLPAWLQQRVVNDGLVPPTVTLEMMIYARSMHFIVDRKGGPVRPHNELLRVPLRHITFTDDAVVPPGAEIEVPFVYPNAIWMPDLKRPADYGAESVGHFGFFRRSMPRAAWDDAANWLLAQLPNKVSAQLPDAKAAQPDFTPRPISGGCSRCSQIDDSSLI